MFNEILTGKATLAEPQQHPDTTTPYREQGVLPPVRHACVTCNQLYQAPAGSTAGLCGTCRLDIVEMNARNDQMAFQLAEDEARRRANSHKLFGIIGSVVVAAGLIAFKFGMRSQMREDVAVGAGYSSYDHYKAERDAVYPTDEYSYRIRDLAGDMCRCTDLKCARDLGVVFTSFIRSHSPSDDKSEASARADMIRLSDCQQRLETGEPAATP